MLADLHITIIYTLYYLSFTLYIWLTKHRSKTEWKTLSGTGAE